MASRSTTTSSTATAHAGRLGSLHALRGHPLPVGALWVLGLTGIGLSLVLPSQVGKLTALFGAGRQVTWPPVLQSVGYLLAAQLCLSLVSFLRSRTEHRLQEGMSRSLTLTLYARILRFSADFFRDQEVERINSRVLEDTGRVVGFWIGALVAVPVAAASVVVFGAVMIADNWFLGLCMLVLAALSGYFIVFDRQIQAASRQARETWDSIRVSANEVVSAVSELRNHFAFEYGLAGLRGSLDHFRDVMMRIGRLMALFAAIDPLVGTIQTGVLFSVGAALCISGSPLAAFAGQMTWAEVIKFLLLAQLFRGPIAQIAGQILQWRMAGESIRRINEYMARPCTFEARHDGARAMEGVPDVAYEGVSVAGASGADILKGLDLAVRRGEHVAVSGPAGCGKSTLLQMIVRGVEPTSGRLRLAGATLDQHDLLSLARRVGFVPQTPILLHTSIRNNLLLGLRRRSDGALHDGEGPLDVAHLPGVRTLEDLDRELVKVVRAVALTDDAIAKCLDSPLPQTPAAHAVRRRIGELRRHVTAAIEGAASEWLIHFDRDRWIPGTLGENLLGPACETPAEASPKVMAALTGSPLLADLLVVGYRRFCSEHALAARVSRDRPGLLNLLPDRGDVPGTGELLMPPGRVSPTELPVAFQEALLAVALATEGEQARQLAPSELLRDRAVEARNRHFASVQAAGGAWGLADSSSYVDGLSLRENVLGGRADSHVHGAQDRADRLARQALAAAQLEDAAVLLGLEFRVGDRGKLLSGGQRQKIAIGRIALKTPSLLVMDEATASLDELSQARIVDMVREDFRDRTVISVSHRLASIRHCDRVVVLDRGQVVQEGPFDRLAEQDGILRDLVRREQAALGGQAPPEAPAPAGRPAEQIDPMELRRWIALSPLFSGLDSDQRAFVESAMQVIHAGADEVLFRRGDPGQSLYVVLEGTVEFFVDRSEDAPAGVNVLSSAGPGEVFGELAMFGNGLRTVGARTRAAATLGVLGRGDLVEIIRADPTVAVELLGFVSGYLARTCDAVYGPAGRP